MADPTTRRLSLIATCTIIPLALWLAFGFTFTSPKNITSGLWAFVWFTFLLNIPAVLASWFFPKFSALWVLINTAISMVIAAGFLWHSSREDTSGGGSLLAALSQMAVRALVWACFLWLPQLLFSITMLYHLHRTISPSRKIAKEG